LACADEKQKGAAGFIRTEANLLNWGLVSLQIQHLGKAQAAI